MNAAILVFALTSVWLSGYFLRKRTGLAPEGGYVVLLLQSVIGYAVFVGLFALYEWHLEAALNAFDLNKDGVFGAEEQSAAQRAALDAYINDAGRNIFKLLAPAVFLLLALVRCGAAWVRRRRAGGGGTR